MKDFFVQLLRILGIDSFVYNHLRHQAEQKKWRTAMRAGETLHTNGLCVAVDMHAFSSETIIGHDFLRKMRQTSIPFQAFDISTKFSDQSLKNKNDVEDVEPICEPFIRFKTVLTFANRHFGFSGPFTFATQPAWEFEAGLLDFHPKIFNGINHIVANSDFCYNYFRKIAPKTVSVHKIRYPFIPPSIPHRSRTEIRSAYKIPLGAFVVLFHFNMGSSIARKNPEAALKACVKAFSGDYGAHLVIKVAGCSETSAEFLNLKKQIQTSGIKASLINRQITRQEIFDLMFAADVYISLHRGEGFGMGMLEAMSLGTPVICTNYGGNTEFCRKDTAFLVDFKTVVNNTNDFFYRGVKSWPDPNTDQAAQYLKLLRENPRIGKDVAARALKFINNYFSTENFEDDVNKFLKAIS